MQSSVFLYGQTGVGKIVGKIADEETSESIVGATVKIKGTNKGAITDQSGNFIILNVLPGTYEVEIRSIGYKSKEIQDIRIVSGITYELKATLGKGEARLKEVQVTSRKLIEEKSTNTVKVVDASEITRLPVKGVENVAALQAGVVKTGNSEDKNSSLYVRGGRSGEVLFIVDGVPQNDVYDGGNTSQVSSAAVEQLSFQVGGFEAKYGQAQSGVISITTKKGKSFYTAYGEAATSSFTDDYGYNSYVGNISGPWIPGISDHTFFISFERGWFADPDPSSQSLHFGSTGKDYTKRPNTSSGVWKITGNSVHNFGDFTLRLGTNINTRDANLFNLAYSKNNSEHNPRYEMFNGSYNARLSQNISSNAYWNLNVGYKNYKSKLGDGIWFDDIWAYGSVAKNAQIGTTLPREGYVLSNDTITGLFASKGRVYNAFEKRDDNSFNVDFDFTAQLKKHLIEFGVGVNYNILRYYYINPANLAYSKYKYSDMPTELMYYLQQPSFFGYDITGNSKSDIGSGDKTTVYNYGTDYVNKSVTTSQAPRTPVIAYGYFQDKIELNDLIINLGLRMDYFDTQAKILKNMLVPFAGGTDPNDYDSEDFKTKDPEIYFSPRIGLGFPVTDKTVFHAQYGRFIQQPPLSEVFTNVYELQQLLTDQNLQVNNGDISCEKTTQYELGIQQVLGNNDAALNVTAFYKNTEGLLDTRTYYYYKTADMSGQRFKYIATSNTDFGTVKGLALTLDIPRISYFSLNIDYTYSIAEGTGSSTSSSFTAAFRNDDGSIPKVIAPLSFDQRHTGIVNLNFYIPRGESGFLSYLEELNANLLFSFNSGRPYTPLESQNLVAGTTNYGSTKGYVNSATRPGNYRFDLKIEKGFRIKDLTISPYVIVENLFNTELINNVYQATGDPRSSGWLESTDAQTIISGRGSDIAKYRYVQDYMSYERNPSYLGIPRLIKLGVRVNFTNINL